MLIKMNYRVPGVRLTQRVHEFEVPDGAHNFSFEIVEDDPAFVRIRFRQNPGQVYAYQNPDMLKKGDKAIVDSPISGPTIVEVIGIGRGSYSGVIHKMARRLPNLKSSSPLTTWGPQDFCSNEEYRSIEEYR